MRNRMLTIYGLLLSAFFSMLLAQSPGDLVLTEFMANPAAVSDGNGEYVEFYNTTGSAIDINGFTLRDDDGNTHTIDNGGPLMAPALGFIVLGNNGDPGANGGYTANYVYSNFFIGNSGDEIVLETSGGTEICRLDYTNGDPFGPGVSAELNNVASPVGGVSAEGDYVAATSTYGAGDFGSPGEAGNTVGAGGGDPQPVISDIDRLPWIPEIGQATTVSASISDNGAITNAELIWTVDGANQQSVGMVNVGPSNIWSGEIPGSVYVNGALVEYWINATDDSSQTSESAHLKVYAGDSPISALRVNDANGVPLNRGAYARITGTATVGNSIFSTINLDVYLQDDTGGINLFQFSANDTVTITPGNSYTVVGQLDQFSGKTEIITDDASMDVIDNGPVGAATPFVTTIANLLSDPETYEGVLIKILGLTNTNGGDTWPAVDNDANVQVTDDGGTSLLTLRVDRDTDIDGSQEPAWPVDVTGVFVQFDNSPPYDEGYQIQPRSLNDFSGGGDPAPFISNVNRGSIIPEPGVGVDVSADITDDSDVSAAEVRWTINGSTAVASAAMSLSGGTTWTGTIPGDSYVNGDLLEYWVWAEDDAPQSVESQHDTVFTGDTPIAVARTNDGEGAPLYDGLYARVTGVATVGNTTYSTTHLDVYIQDETAAINVFRFDADGEVTITPGNSYSVTGVIDQFSGKTEIIPDSAALDVIDNGPATLPAPLNLSVSEILANPEAYESMLIVIPGLSNTGGGDPWPADGDNANVQVTDDGGTTLFTLRVDRDTDIDGSPEPTWPVNVAGIMTQFDLNAPFDEGYQILPRSLADFGVTVGLDPIDENIAKAFRLHQNYPNPFNPSTMIRFDVPADAGNIELLVFNTLGQKVVSLINDKLSPGSYEITWNALAANGNRVPSGIYFAVLKNGNRETQRMKMVLLK